MKRMKILLCLFSVVMLASLAAPIVAAEKPTRMEFRIAGDIFDESRGMYGIMSLTLTGSFRERTPDVDREDSGEYTSGPYEYTWNYTNYWTEDGVDYKEEVDLYEYSYYWETYQQHIVKWYSPLPSYRGTLVVIWEDGSTSTFKVSLSPFEIGTQTYELTSESTYFNEEQRVIYRWDPIMGWTYVSEWFYRYGYEECRTEINSGFTDYFIGQIHEKGTPLKGILAIGESNYWAHVEGTNYYDGQAEDYEYTNEYYQFMTSGKFGPYSLSAYIYG